MSLGLESVTAPARARLVAVPRSSNPSRRRLLLRLRGEGHVVGLAAVRHPAALGRNARALGPGRSGGLRELGRPPDCLHCLV